MKYKKNISQKEEITEKVLEDVRQPSPENTVESKEIPCDKTESDKIIEEQKSKIEELNDKYLRLYAEFDNFRRRTAKERIELSKNAASELIFSLLPVLDDYERALNALPDEESHKSIKEGLVLIYNKYKNILTKNGLEEIKTIGESFNTDIHEAIANVDTEDENQKGKIIDLVEKGYYLNGIVLRFAKVIVAN